MSLQIIHIGEHFKYGSRIGGVPHSKGPNPNPLIGDHDLGHPVMHRSAIAGRKSEKMTCSRAIGKATV